MSQYVTYLYKRYKKHQKVNYHFNLYFHGIAKLGSDGEIEPHRLHSQLTLSELVDKINYIFKLAYSCSHSRDSHISHLLHFHILRHQEIANLSCITPKKSARTITLVADFYQKYQLCCEQLEQAKQSLIAKNLSTYVANELKCHQRAILNVEHSHEKFIARHLQQSQVDKFLLPSPPPQFLSPTFPWTATSSLPPNLKLTRCYCYDKIKNLVTKLNWGQYHSKQSDSITNSHKKEAKIPAGIQPLFNLLKQQDAQLKLITSKSQGNLLAHQLITTKAIFLTQIQMLVSSPPRKTIGSFFSSRRPHIVHQFIQDIRQILESSSASLMRRLQALEDSLATSTQSNIFHHI